MEPMTFNLDMSSGNSAFEPNVCTSEVVRILREVADAVESGRDSGAAKDINGNTVGHWYYGQSEKEEIE